MTVGAPEFTHALAGHCASGSLRDVLAHRGLDFGAGPLSEGMCFGLGSGLGFLYADVPAETPAIYVVGRTEALEEAFAENLGIDLDVRETDDRARAAAWLDDELQRGRPPIVWSDIAELEYLRVRMSNTRHAIVIAGVDREAGVAWIADNDREELQPCSLASLARARDSRGFPGRNRNRTFVFDWPTSLSDPAGAARAAITGAVANMRNGGTRLGGLDAPAGLQGVEAFTHAYRRWPDDHGDALPGVLAALSIFIVKAGTGGALFRSLWAEFLHDMASLLDDPGLRAAAVQADGLAAGWRELAAVARAADHAAGIPIADRLLDEERAQVELLETWLER
ncbi:BtrH N-terminal domain-containing protein [Paraconexibacter algicola]|uniref:DUF4872 domain-containing protein n=1 Tax=Paraconexibacter algicola TaxID=2133960 RepID=A0A2T4UJY8_9ACTN|nr:BtrH N-terminal domain-containing protein [Paraconexibacter algicola]PTL59574.1 hypothetical protein C7Y72_07895 [Paraconexibacter algicola]